MKLEIGSMVGDYQIVGILGAGGMGKVYKVRNVISDRIEAMKVLLPDLVAETELADRFLREIKTQASLEHPNIAALHTALRVENQLLMLMEFVEGQTLEQRLKSGPLPVEQAVDYMSQVLSALDYAHQHGVIHRDIKPANMMLTPHGLVKLMDFGIAKSSADHRLTMTGTTMGSLYYMSPEQIQGAAHIDSRADLYSVGVSLYELVTGKRPFDGDSQFAIMSAHLEKTPVPPVEVDPRLPRALNDAILMSVAKDPNLRFQGAGAFRAALQSVAPSVAAQPVTPPHLQAAPVPPAQAITRPVGPPQAAPAPPPLQAPNPQPSAFAPMAAAPATAAKKSKRGLWMAVGALAAAAAAIAVIELMPPKGTKASTGTAQTQPVETSTAQPQPPVSQPAANSPSAPASTGSTQPVLQASPPPSQPAQQTAAVKTRPGKSAPAQVASAGPQNPPLAQPQPQAQQPVQVPPTPVQQSVQQPVQQPAAAPAQPAGPSRAEVMKSQERFGQLQVRSTGIHGTLDTMQRAQQASGLNLSSKFTQPESLMDMYLRSAQDAIRDKDLDTAKDFMDKAEIQVGVLEKLLNR